MYAKQVRDNAAGSLTIGEPHSASGSGSTLRSPSQGRKRRATPDEQKTPATAGEPS